MVQTTTESPKLAGSKLRANSGSNSGTDLKPLSLSFKTLLLDLSWPPPPTENPRTYSQTHLWDLTSDQNGTYYHYLLQVINGPNQISSLSAYCMSTQKMTPFYNCKTKSSETLCGINTEALILRQRCWENGRDTSFWYS